MIVFITTILVGLFFPLVIYLIQATRSVGVSILVLSLVGINGSMMIPAVLNYFQDKFPPRIKITAMSFAYNISLAIFGGMAPAVSTALFKVSKIAPSFPVPATAVLALIGMCFAVNILPASEIVEETDSFTVSVGHENELSPPELDPLSRPLLIDESLSTHNNVL
uniref:Major facilitator superfamily (MFS) profile domain-containing protein n=1 Tax=Eucampia antarctica TaxID=49252 RepID=A0A7S2R1R5_9STRA